MGMKVFDFRKLEESRLILVVENVYETRAGIDTLLGKRLPRRFGKRRRRSDKHHSAPATRPDTGERVRVTRQRSRQGGSRTKGRRKRISNKPR